MDRWKYPLAVMEKVLNTQDSDSMMAYDVGCKFYYSLLKSALGPLFVEKRGHMCVPAFHGYTHNYICQLSFHPNIIEGMGIEDAETLERTFSGSNALAPITRFASSYRRSLAIESYMKQVDDDKYQSSGLFILKNIIQALEIIQNDGEALKREYEVLNLNEDLIKSYIQEQREFFAQLGEETQYNLHEVAYVEALQKLRDLENERQTVNTRFSGFMTVDPSSSSYEQDFSKGRKIETERRTVNDSISNVMRELNELEVLLQIARTDRWTPAHPKYKETRKFIVERDYRAALEEVQRLVILRLFELHRLNLARIGT